MSLDEKVENIINGKSSLFRRGVNFLKRKSLPYIFISSIAVTGIIGCTTRSTPESTVKSYISAIKEGDLETIFEYQGLNNDNIKLIKENITQQELDYITEKSDNVSVEIVKTKYAIVENEEVAIVQIILTGSDGRKKQSYIYLANHNGEWTVFKEFGERLPWGMELYDNPTTNKKSSSKLIEEHVKDLTSSLFEQKIRKNELAIKNLLKEIMDKEDTYCVRFGRYGSLEELAKADLISKDINFENVYGYRIELVQLEALKFFIDSWEYAFKATPIKPRITGKNGFYIDRHHAWTEPMNEIILEYSTDREFNRIRGEEEEYQRKGLEEYRKKHK